MASDDSQDLLSAALGDAGLSFLDSVSIVDNEIIKLLIEMFTI